MKASRPTDYALGLSVTPRTVQGVLVERTPEGPRLVRRFTRSRTAASADAFAYSPTPSVALAAPDEDAATLTIGEGRPGSELFLASEFGLAGTAAPVGGGSTAAPPPDLYVDEIADILAECRTGSAADPALAAVLAPSDVVYAELRLPEVEKEKQAKQHARFLAALQDVAPEADPARATFLPMTVEQGSGQVRTLCVAPTLRDGVTQTLLRLRERVRPVPAMRLEDAELPLLIGLARRAPTDLPHARSASLPPPPSLGDVYGYGADPYAAPAPDPAATPDPGYPDAGYPDAGFGLPGAPEAGGDGAPAPAGEPVALGAPDPFGPLLLVRVGMEDTLVVFLYDGVVHHFEHMRSLNASDAPETICSRVLLLQDEHVLPEVHRILVLADQNEAGLVESFGLFFPEAQAGSVRSLLPEGAHDEVFRAEDAAVVPAFAAALRLTAPARALESFPATNFLPATLQKRQRVAPGFSWHVPLLLGLIVLTALFFTSRYVLMQRQIEDERARVQAADPEAAAASVATLQARVDSLQQVQDRYTRALAVLDTLLVGSDQWSRALETVSTQAASTRGMWVESWKHDGSALTLTGNSTSRERVVQFTEGTKGDLQTLTFSEIRDFPVYSFTLKLPLSTELPEAARYLREEALRVADSLRAAGATGAPAAVVPAGTGAPAAVVPTTP